MGALESLTAVIAIATTASAFFGYQKIKDETMNPMLIQNHWKIGDYVFFNMKIFPGKTQSNIRKISSNAEGICLWHDYNFSDALFSTVGGKKHHKSAAVDFSLLPDSLSTDPLELVFSIKPRKDQSSFTIKLYTSSSLFSARCKLSIADTSSTD